MNKKVSESLQSFHQVNNNGGIQVVPKISLFSRVTALKNLQLSEVLRIPTFLFFEEEYGKSVVGFEEFTCQR